MGDSSRVDCYWYYATAIKCQKVPVDAVRPAFVIRVLIQLISGNPSLGSSVDQLTLIRMEFTTDVQDTLRPFRPRSWGILDVLLAI